MSNCSSSSDDEDNLSRPTEFAAGMELDRIASVNPVVVDRRKYVYHQALHYTSTSPAPQSSIFDPYQQSLPVQQTNLQAIPIGLPICSSGEPTSAPQSSEVTNSSTACTGTDVLCETFKHFLRRKASELSGLRDPLLAKQNIGIAPLQISTESRNFALADEIGHFHHRKELAEVFNKPPSSNVNYTEIFRAARSQAARQAQVYCNTVEAKEKFLLTHGNIVGVAGQAGIGKTTLTKTLVQKMLNEGLYGVDYVFYLKFRDINYKKKMHVLEFLTNDSSVCRTFPLAELEEILKALEINDKVGIILDGFDEAIIKSPDRRFQDKCSIYDIEKAEIFIKNLLHGSIFPRAKLLVTSRPRQLLHLHEDYKPKFIVNVLGLGGEGQKQICNDICNKEQTQVNKLTQYLNDRLDLKGYCYVPINCILVMLCVYLNFQTSDMINMNSITTILVATLGLFINNGHLNGEDFQIKNLCDLAHTGFQRNRLYFEKEDIAKAKINAKNATAFLTTSIAKNLKLWEGIEASRTYFSHLMLQEFFVALYLLLFADESLFKNSLKALNEDKYEMVAKFLFGLCNSTTMHYLRRLISPNVIDISQVDAKLVILKAVVSKKVQDFGKSYPYSETHNGRGFRILLQCSSWAYELRDDSFTTDVANCLPEQMKIMGDVLPTDIPSLHYLLRARANPLIVTKLDVNVTEDTLEQFYSELAITLQTSKVNIESLHVRNCNRNEVCVAVSHCLKSICSLYIENDTYSIGKEMLCKAVQELDKPLQHLEIRGGMIGVEWFRALALCVDQTKKLVIKDVDDEKCFSDKGIQLLATAIQKLSKPIEMLDVMGCILTVEGIVALASCVNKIKKLRIGPIFGESFQTEPSKKQLTTILSYLVEAVSNMDHPIELTFSCLKSQQHLFVDIFRACECNVTNICFISY